MDQHLQQIKRLGNDIYISKQNNSDNIYKYVKCANSLTYIERLILLCILDLLKSQRKNRWKLENLPETSNQHIKYLGWVIKHLFEV